MNSPSLRIFALLSLCVPLLIGCLEETNQHVSNMDQNMAKMAQSMQAMSASVQDINLTAEEGLSKMDKRIQSFERVFQSAVEQLSFMADTVAKLDRLLELIVYVEKMAVSLEGMGESVEKLEVLIRIAEELADKLGVNLEEYFENPGTPTKTTDEIEEDLGQEYDV